MRIEIHLKGIPHTRIETDPYNRSRETKVVEERNSHLVITTEDEQAAAFQVLDFVAMHLPTAKEGRAKDKKAMEIHFALQEANTVLKGEIQALRDMLHRGTLEVSAKSLKSMMPWATDAEGLLRQ